MRIGTLLLLVAALSVAAHHAVPMGADMGGTGMRQHGSTAGMLAGTCLAIVVLVEAVVRLATQRFATLVADALRPSGVLGVLRRPSPPPRSPPPRFAQRVLCVLRC